MNRFVTTYRRDYEWPYVRSTRFAADLKPSSRKFCPCGGKSLKRETAASKCEKALAGDAFEWSRLGPMGPLLDPKLYPAQPTPMPRIEAPTFGRQEEHVKELSERYPYLSGILQCSPASEVRRIVGDDRLTSTYQQDFADPVTGLLKYRDCAAVDGLHLPPRPPLDCPARCEDAFRQQSEAGRAEKSDHRRSRRGGEERKSDEDDDNDNSRKRRKKNEEDAEEDAEASLPTWKSEYQNVIAQTGEAIIRHRMHCRKQKESSREKPDD